jgi:hypothetical protein
MELSTILWRVMMMKKRRMIHTTNWKISFYFHLRNFGTVTLLTGGGTERHGSQTCAVLPVMYSLFLVSGHLMMFIVSKLGLSQGSAVAVERSLSGGHDTISLRRAALKPDTIRILMLVKQKVKLERED